MVACGCFGPGYGLDELAGGPHDDSHGGDPGAVAVLARGCGALGCFQAKACSVEALLVLLNLARCMALASIHSCMIPVHASQASRLNMQKLMHWQMTRCLRCRRWVGVNTIDPETEVVGAKIPMEIEGLANLPQSGLDAAIGGAGLVCTGSCTRRADRRTVWSAYSSALHQLTSTMPVWWCSLGQCLGFAWVPVASRRQICIFVYSDVIQDARINTALVPGGPSVACRSV